MIVRIDAAMYGVLLLDLLLGFNWLWIPRIAHVIATRNQNQSYGSTYFTAKKHNFLFGCGSRVTPQGERKCTSEVS